MYFWRAEGCANQMCGRGCVAKNLAYGKYGDEEHSGIKEITESDFRYLVTRL